MSTSKRVRVHDPAAPAPASEAHTPSAQLVREGLKEATLDPDPKGRVIVLAKPGILEQSRLVRILGVHAQNAAYMEFMLPLTYVKSIDGALVPPATKEAELEALLKRLDEDGFIHVKMGIAERFYGVKIEVGPDGKPIFTQAEGDSLEAAKTEVKK